MILLKLNIEFQKIILFYIFFHLNTLPTNFDNTELDLGYTGNAETMESAIKDGQDQAGYTLYHKNLGKEYFNQNKLQRPKNRKPRIYYISKTSIRFYFN